MLKRRFLRTVHYYKITKKKEFYFNRWEERALTKFSEIRICEIKIIKFVNEKHSRKKCTIVMKQYSLYLAYFQNR